ncbi:MAG: hypothetical protein HFI63_10610 [Lachnospiraceae bacterium]|nr:hypothetical protein [Lachnospiraceae bacterium]
MRERINRLAKGMIDYDEIQVSFSTTKIKTPVVFDDKMRDEFRIVCRQGRTVKGLVYSTNYRVSLFSDNFIGKDCRIVYEVDASYADEDITGEFHIVCSGGEFRIPYCFEVCAVDPEGREIKTLEEFAVLVREDEEEGLRFFESSDFTRCPFMQDAGIRTLYDGLWGRGNRQNALEEFLVGTGTKKPVRFSIQERKKEYQIPPEPFTDGFTILRNAWGYMRLEIASDSPWLKVSRQVVTDRDFDGSACVVSYMVDTDRLHAGKNYGRIFVKGIYGEEVIPVSVVLRSNRRWADGLSWKRDFGNFVSLYLRQEAEEYERNLLLNSMQTALARAHVTAKEPLCIRLYQADVSLLQEKREQARQFLGEVREAVLDNREQDVETYCYYMYLKAKESKEALQRQTLVKLLRRYYEDGMATDMAFYVLMQMDEELLENDSLALSRLKEHFRNGSRSPYLYLAACRLLKKSPELLRVMEEFEIQSLWFGCRHRLITKDMAKLAALQALQVKGASGLYFRLLKELYELYPSGETLTAVCALLIRSDVRDREAFSWYERGVEEDIHLTRLYEYYLYALPEDFAGALPRMILLYFSYNHTLDYRARAVLYLNVLKFMKDDEEVYRAYEGQIENFAVEQLFQSHMNGNLAQIYREMIFPEMMDEKIARVLPKLLYAKEIRCANDRMCQAVLCYEEMKGETTVTLRKGRAYIPVYLENVCVLFQDDYGSRYCGVPYAMEDMIKSDALEAKTQELYPAHEMLRLLKCQKVLARKAYRPEDIEVLKDISQEENIHGLYRKKLVSELVSYYYGREETDECDEYLLELDKKLLSSADRGKVMETLITKDFYEEAYRMAIRYGYRSLSPGRVFKMTAKMILKRHFEKDTMLLEMAYHCFEQDRYDDVVIEYLCCHYNGLAPAMDRILAKADKEGIALYDMPERLLAQMLFDGIRNHLDRVFSCYIKGKSVDESLVRAYLVVKSSRYFEESEPFDRDVIGYIEVQAEQYEVRDNLPEICMLALTKYYSMAERLTEKQAALCQSIIDELFAKKIVFGYYKYLGRFIELPRDLMGKTAIEYQGRRNQSVWIHQRLLPGDGEVVVETMPHMFGGYFVKLVSLFYGETMEYEIYDGGDEPVMQGTAVYSGDGTAPPGSRVGRLDGILRVQAFDDDTLKKRMEAYAVRDEMTERLFECL